MGMLDGIGGTGILSTMKYVNIDQQLPRIGIRQQQAMGLKNGYVPAEMHRDYEPPLADMGVSLVKVDIDFYPCRKAYGYLNNTDFAQTYGQKGQQDIAAATSRHTQEGWDMAKNGAKPGESIIGRQNRSHFWNQVVKWPTWVAKDIPDPVFTVTPSEIKGQMNVGHDKYSIKPQAKANIDIRVGEAETYIATEGSIRMWTTEGHYDIQA